ncbi:MAG: hypothetical protein ACI9TF_001905 [Paracrocinitomix sp.]
MTGRSLTRSGYDCPNWGQPMREYLDPSEVHPQAASHSLQFRLRYVPMLTLSG